MPFLIADKVPEDEEDWPAYEKYFWHCFSPHCYREFLLITKLSIRDHHLKFVKLYGVSSYIPMMHFLCHYPEQMSNLGSMLNTKTMPI